MRISDWSSDVCSSDLGLGAAVKLLRGETKRPGATLLVFDGLLNARDRADTDLDVKTFVAEVQSQAGFVGCTVLFLTSTRLEDRSPDHTMVRSEERRGGNEWVSTLR